MGNLTVGNLVAAKGLTKVQLQEIINLDKICSDFEKLNMKLNLDMLDQRLSEEMNDFLYYSEGKLVGFLGLYDMDRKADEIEITGMVHPGFRRKGIFKELFTAGIAECKRRDAKKVLLVSEKSSLAGAGFIGTTGAIYTTSEYRMKFEGSEVPDCKKVGIQLKKADRADKVELDIMDTEFFGKHRAEEKAEEEIKVDVENLGTDSLIADSESELEHEVDNESDAEFDNPAKSTYLALLDGKTIGKIGTVMEGTDGYIYGVGILPEFRGRGYGRELLGLALGKLIVKKVYTVLLEVAVKNENALQLYKSCGFREVTVYDYYEL